MNQSSRFSPTEKDGEMTFKSTVSDPDLELSNPDSQELGKSESLGSPMDSNTI